MKPLKTTIIALFILINFSCSKNDDGPEPEPLQTYLKKITTSSSIITYHYDENNRITLEEHANASSALLYLYRNFYNSDGQLIERTQDETDAPFSYKYTYHYNTDGKLNKIETYTINSGGAPAYFSKSEADYSVPGKISYNSTPSTGTIPYLLYEYFLDSKENVIERLMYSPSGVLQNTTEYTSFDDKKSPEQLLPNTSYIKSFNNNLTYTYIFNGTGEVSNRAFTYEYNEDGYPTKSTDNTGSIITYEYIKR